MKELFGHTKDGLDVYKFTINDNRGNKVSFVSIGAAIQSLIIDNTDVVLGFDSVEDYETKSGCLGAVVGRCANRISGASFVLDGKTINVSPNKGTYSQHGGYKGFQKHVWEGVEDGDSVTFILFSKDGDEGYPGNLTSKVKYTFKDAVLRIDYDAVSDKKTVINLTNHCYFNLNGNGNVLKHSLMVNSNKVAWSDSNSIPNGELIDVSGNPFDLKEEKSVDWAFDSKYELFASKGGYDHNFIFDNNGEFKKVASCMGDKTKIRMDVFTDQDDVVLYTANSLPKMEGKNKVLYSNYSGICFECQYMTNAVNLEGFRKPIFDKNQHFTQHTEYRFSTAG